MPRVSKFTVVPQLPKSLSKLLDIANNVWWSWHPDAIELFIRIDREGAWQFKLAREIKEVGFNIDLNRLL